MSVVISIKTEEPREIEVYIFSEGTYQFGKKHIQTHHKIVIIINKTHIKLKERERARASSCVWFYFMTCLISRSI